MVNILFSMIAAVAQNGVIGYQDAMPWHLSSDSRRFKSLTMGKPLLMGRKCFQSIGQPLPGRTSIVITKNAQLTFPDGVIKARSLDEGMALAEKQARRDAVGEVMILGGGEIYKALMPRADRLYITHIEANPDGDTFFPAIDAQIWRGGETLFVPAGEKDSAATRYVVYDRKK